MVQFPEDVTDSFTLSTVQMGTGAHTDSYSMGKWGAFPQGYSGWGMNSSAPLFPEPTLRMAEGTCRLSLYAFMA